jgi:hypothetical protein
MEQPKEDETAGVLATSEKAGLLARNTAYILDIFIVVSTFALVLLIMFAEVPASNKELVYTAFGSLLTLCLTVVQFHRGSSAHSAKKDDTIQRLSKEKQNDLG